MGILYLDETGNTGLHDKKQKLLIYGGPYVNVSEWKTVSNNLAGIQRKYLGIITSRFRSGLVPGANTSQFLKEIGTNIDFLQNFHFHAKNIINRTGLWSKLTIDECFNVLEEILEILIENNIHLYIGVLDKEKYVLNQEHSKKRMAEYYVLYNEFFDFLEKNVPQQDQIVTIIDDGNSIEKEILKKRLNDPSRRKFFGELICGKPKDYPLLQVADIGVWIFQAYHRLNEGRQDDYAKRVKGLFSKVNGISKVHWCVKTA